MILSRYFNIEEYGLYKQVLFVYSSILAISTLGLPKAFSYFLPKSPIDKAKSLINKLTYAFIVLGGIMSLILFLGAQQIANLLNAPNLVTPLRIFSPVPFMMLPTMGLEGVLSTYRCTKFMALYNFTTRLVMLLCVALPVMVWNVSCNMALVGFNIGSAFAFVLALYLKYYPVRHAGSETTNVTYRNIFNFCMPLFVATLWGTLINSTSQYFISRFFGTETFAIFSNGAMELPFVGMIIASSSSVLTPLFTRMVHEKKDLSVTMLPTWRSVFAKSAMIIYPMTVFCIAMAEPIMTLMYGEQYAASALFFRYSLLTYFVKVIIFYSIIIALGATRFYQYLHAVHAIGLIITDLLIVILCHNPYLIALNMSLWAIFNVVCMELYISRKTGISMIKLIPVSTLIRVIAACALGLIVMFGIDMLLTDVLPLYRLGICAIIFLLSVFAVSIPLRLRYLDILKPLYSR